MYTDSGPGAGERINMDFEKHEELNRLRGLLGIPHPKESPIDSWAACARIGNDLLLSWLSESDLVYLDYPEREQLELALAKSDAGPDAAMLKIHRTLDTTTAGNCELSGAARLLAKAVRLRRAHTQRRWVAALQRLFHASGQVDSGTRDIALRALLQTDNWANVEWLLNGITFVTEVGVKAMYLKELNLKPEILQRLLDRFPDFAAEVERHKESGEQSDY